MRDPGFPSNSIRVEGGTGPRLPPAQREPDGTPDPEVVRMLGEGAARYHLETLRALDAESRGPRAETAETTGSVDPPSRAHADRTTPRTDGDRLLNRRARRAAAARQRHAPSPKRTNE